ncbi:MAG: N-(5'-phosphoribosyl)anthranilate isomerase [Deltaproteobacteria bacterium]|nr:MAG: N-(5'-phosphoribosyl)anthranilate isomerase [Deltaproteobacteria bacterium]
MKYQQRTRVKLCGITRLEDATAAVKEGVDALGFVFCEESPRNIDPEDARLIIETLPPMVQAAGVFTDLRRKEVEEIVHYCGLGLVQLHGAESIKYCERLSRKVTPCRVLKALQVVPGLSAAEITPFDPFVHGYLLDIHTDDGKHKKDAGTFDCYCSLIEQLQLQRPYLLSGGLDSANVEQCLREVQPFGVDVAAGVEETPGIKNHALIREFMRKVRAFDHARTVSD